MSKTKDANPLTGHTQEALLSGLVEHYNCLAGVTYDDTTMEGLRLETLRMIEETMDQLAEDLNWRSLLNQQQDSPSTPHASAPSVLSFE